MLGGAIVSRLLGKSYEIGLQHGGVLLRLPFFLAASMLGTVAGVALSVNISRSSDPENSGSSALEGAGSRQSTTQPTAPPETPKSPTTHENHQSTFYEI